MSVETKEKILDAAERRVRKAGFAEMSFRDLAADIGIKSASVHYHFPTKPELGEALIVRYAERFQQKLDDIPLNDLDTALNGFLGLYDEAFVLDEAICLCAIMGAEAMGLPAAVNQRTKAFFEMNRNWLQMLLRTHSIQSADDMAAMIVAALEGGMIVASASNDRTLFNRVATTAINCAINK